MASLLVAALQQLDVKVIALEGLSSYHAHAGAYPDKKSTILKTWASISGAILDMRPDLWITYHSYYKSPDLIGPSAAAQYGLPYVIFEPSYAPNKRDTAWAEALSDAARSFECADLLFVMKQKDRQPLSDLLGTDSRLVTFPPFIDPAPFLAEFKDTARRRLCERIKRSKDVPIILCTAMMRPGKKLESYRFLAAALSRLSDIPWHLVIAGSGPRRNDVEQVIDALESQTTFLGQISADELPAIYRAADVFAWPGIGEAYGMVYLEAGAAGLPAIAVDGSGVREVIQSGKTGVLTEPNSVEAYASALRDLLSAPERQSRIGQAAQAFVTGQRSVTTSLHHLDPLKKLVEA